MLYKHSLGKNGTYSEEEYDDTSDSRLFAHLYRLKQINYPFCKIRFVTIKTVILAIFISYKNIKLPFFNIPNTSANIKQRPD